MVELGVAPLLIGGNKPVLIAVYALAIGTLGSIYAFHLLRRRRRLAVGASRVRLEIVFWSAVAVVTFVQLIPDVFHLVPDIVSVRGVRVALPQISTVPGDTFLLGLHWLGLGMMFFLSAQVVTREGRANGFLLALFYVVVFYAGWSLLSLTQLGDTVLGNAKTAYRGSATGTFINRDNFATFASMGVVTGVSLLLGQLRDSSSRVPNSSGYITSVLPLVVGTLIGLSAVVASASRMGMISCSVGVAVVLGVALLRRQNTWLLSTTLAGGVGVTASVFWLYGGALLDRLGTNDVISDARWPLYSQVWAMILARPLLGYGVGSFEYVFPLFHDAPVSFDFLWDKAHSIYLTQWVERGLLVGSLPPLLGCVIGARLLLNHFRVREIAPNKMAALGALVVCGVHSTLDFSLEIPAVAYLFAAILGSGVGTLGSGAVGGRK